MASEDFRLQPPRWRRLLPDWVVRLFWADRIHHYEAFLSYNWATDKQVAAVIQSVLQQFLRPLFRTRARNIFRDLVSLPAGGSLEDALRDRLDRSAHLIVLANREAAASEGMNFEVGYWFARSREGTVVVVVTDGEYHSWEEIRRNAVPPALRDAVIAPPVFASVSHRRQRMLGNPGDRELRHELVEDLKQVFLRLYPDSDWGQMQGEERSIRRKTLAAISIAIGGLIVFAAVAGQQGFEAHRQARLAATAVQAERAQAEQAERARGTTRVAQKDADEQRNRALWQSLARESIRAADTRRDDDRAGLLAVQAMHIHDRIPNEPRTFLEEALQRASRATPLGHTLTGPTRPILSIAASADGALLAAGGEDRIVYVWRLKHPHEPGIKLGRHDGAVRTVSFSPDSKYLASAGEDSTIRVWTLDGGVRSRSSLVLHARRAVFSLAFSSSTRLIAGDDEGLQLWDLDRPSTPPINPPYAGCDSGDRVRSVAVSQDGQRVAFGTAYDCVGLWDLRKPSAVEKLYDGPKGIELVRGDDVPNWVPLAFLPDGNKLIANLRIGPHILDVTTPPVSPTPLATKARGWIAVARDGRSVAIGTPDGMINVWDIADSSSRKPVFVFAAHTAAVSSMQFSPSGTILYSAGADQMVRIWDLRAPAPAIWPLSMPESMLAFNAAAFAPDGGHLAASHGDMRVWLWDTARPEKLPALLKNNPVGSVNSLAFSADGRQLASRGGGTWVWDLSHLAASPTVLPPSGWAPTIAFAPDGRDVASYEQDGSVNLWRVQAGARPVAFARPPKRVSRLAFSPDGNALAAGSDDGTITIWKRHQPHDAPVVLSSGSGISALAFSPDSALVASASKDRTIRIWEWGKVGSQPQVLSLDVDLVQSLTFSPDGTWLGIASRFRVQIWELRPLATRPTVLSGDGVQIFALAFSDAGRQVIAATSADVTITADPVLRIWPVSSAAARFICSRVWRNLSPEEWNSFVGSREPYEPTCPNLATGSETR